ncbi:unnamed protein product, partial [Rotaria magnacalcarata]
NEWEDLDQEYDTLDDIIESDQCSIEAASDLISEEEEGDLAYDDDDDKETDEEVNIESDAEDDI